jgi:Icc-related predicted phosphoesterase
LPLCFFATDLHGSRSRYDKLVAAIGEEHPDALFLGGDLLPRADDPDFIHEYLIPVFRRTRSTLGKHYPPIFVILGNDDPRSAENEFITAASAGIWHYIHGQKLRLLDFPIYGLAYVPPTPFRLKDWERYDISRYVPPGCISPEEGFRTFPLEESDVRWGTIRKELGSLVQDDPLERAVFLFHSPPADTALDRAALDGKSYEHVPLDLHVGSIAIKRLIEDRQPLLTLHGHVHEAARLTKEWKIQIGRTVCINAAHDGPELALVRFDLECPQHATRELV